MDTIICPNCGADIAVSEPKCPFCGYINIPGAEEKFMKDLNQTKEELNQLPKMQQEQIKKSFFKSSKVIWITVLVVVLLIMLVSGIGFACSKALDSFTEYDAKTEMLWERENYPILDEMYENGDYDGIIAFKNDLYDINEKEHTNHSLYNWGHADFISFYTMYDEIQESVGFLDGGEELSKYQVRLLVYDCMCFHYKSYENSYISLSEEELATVEEYREYAEEVFYNRLKFTDEEADRLYEDSVEYNVISAKKCFDYAEKIRKRIE